MNRLVLYVLLGSIATFINGTSRANAQLDASENRLVSELESHFWKEDLEFFRRTVNLNSGTMNREGVIDLAKLYEKRFKDLGFSTSLVDLKALNRGCHLIAEHVGERGMPRILLIGHLDTVFEKSSGFVEYKELSKSRVTGPGVSDMKAGNLIILKVLEALSKIGELKSMNVSVMLSGDEEAPGNDPDGSLTTTRRPLIELAERSDIALSFEPTNGNAPDPVVTRRGIVKWHLEVAAKAGHSSLIFNKEMGPGAIFPISQILARFGKELQSEKYLTINAGNMAGGTTVARTAGMEDIKATVDGKINVIPALAEVFGDLRFYDSSQLERVQKKMQKIVDSEVQAVNTHYAATAGIKAQIRFEEKYPAMPSTAGNQKLLSLLSEISQEMNLGALNGNDPLSQGAGDISFAASHVKAALDGLGPVGFDYHTTKEVTDLDSLLSSTKRAAVLIYRIEKRKDLSF